MIFRLDDGNIRLSCQVTLHQVLNYFLFSYVSKQAVILRCIFINTLWQFLQKHEMSCLVAVKVVLIVLKETRPDDGFEKADTCHVIDYIVVLCVTVLS